MGKSGIQRGVAFVAVLAPLAFPWFAPPRSAEETRDLRLHVIPLSNAEKGADGKYLKAYSVTPQEFSDLVGRVNVSFNGTGIRFVFDPELDWAPMLDTELNTDGPNMRTRCNAIAAGIPGKIVCFLRFGSDPNNPTGNGNAYPPPGAGTLPSHVSDVEQNYVALPSRITPNFGLLNQGNGSFVAHELGHYLGLYHTFPGWTDLNGPVFAQFNNVTPSAAKADQAVIDYITARGSTIDALDGDALSDTPPDPSPVLYAAKAQDVCAARAITVTGTAGGKPASFTLTPDPENVMSYFGGCAAAGSPPSPKRFSAQQIKRMKDTLKHSSRKALVASPAFGPRSLQPGSAIARGAGRIDIVATDIEGRAWHARWSSSTPGQTWDHWRPVLTDVAAPNTPIGVVARDSGKLDAFLAGTDGKTWSAAWEKDVASGQWRGWWNVLGGAVPAGGVIKAVSRNPDRLDAFLVSNDGGIYTAAWDQNVASGKWRGWTRIGAGVAKAGSPVAAVARDANKLDVFVAGNDGKTYAAAWDQNVDGGKWRGWWNILTGAIPPGAPITAVSRGPGKLDLFIASTDGGVYTAAWDQSVDSGKWHGWFRIGNVVAKPGSPVAAVARDPQKLDVFVAGSDGKVYAAAWEQNVDGGKWRGWWNVQTGVVAPGSSVAAVARGSTRLDLFIVSADGRIYTAAWEQNVANNQWRGWWPIGG